MAFQARSKVETLEAWPHRAALCARIYFPTDRHALDQGDRAVIDHVVNFFRLVSAARRVELLVMGHADSRGSWEYNSRLGRQRAEAVADALEAGSAGFGNLTVQPVISMGEMYAQQGAPSRTELAQDRRVDIWDGLPPKVRTVPRTTDRLSVIEIESRSFQRNQWESGGDEGIGDAITMTLDAILTAYKNKGKPLKPFLDLGTIKHVSFAKEDATYRVNSVRIEKVSATEYRTAGDFSVVRTKVRYQWGPPNPVVMVMETHRRFSEVGDNWEPKDHARTTYHSRDVPRRKADQNSFLFPPGRWAFQSVRGK